MFRLSADEAETLRFQFGTLKLGRGQHRKYLPYAFTEQASYRPQRPIPTKPGCGNSSPPF